MKDEAHEHCNLAKLLGANSHLGKMSTESPLGTPVFGPALAGVLGRP